MELTNLRQAPFNTTALGVLRGVATYYDLPVSDAFLFGATGHAFLINIHEELCPSGPYCWNRAPFERLAGNLGIEVVDHGFFGAGNGPVPRGEIEAILMAELRRGVPCSLLNMENQLITGFDDTGLLTAQPWAPHVDFPPKHLTFGTWAELGEGIHLSFYTFRRGQPVAPLQAAAAGLEYAVDLHRHPEHHSDTPYGAGPRAYQTWISAVRAGHGNSHGNWWNGTVWAECRAMACRFLREIAAEHPRVADQALALATAFGEIAELVQKASDKELADDVKVAALESAAAREASTIPGLELLAGELRGA
jgi:hypothetical protein